VNKQRANRQMLAKLAVFAVFMFGFGFAMVPFYKAFCEVTGINDFIRPTAAVRNTQVDTTRWVTLELDANIHGMPWEFRPLTRTVRFHPGEMVQVMYEVRNLGAAAMVGQAIPSYGPKVASRHVNKLECFCFKQQTLAAGEIREMPVQIIIDAGLPKEINVITLSYTFFEVGGKSAQAGKGRAG